MTDGIIQKVFNKLLTEYHDMAYNEGYQDMPIATALHELSILQQELIEEIKKLIEDNDEQMKSATYKHDRHSNKRLVKKLIGDNQE